MSKINTIDLFAGCGGLTEGFEQTGKYNLISAVEWDKAPVDCLRYRLMSKWGMEDAQGRILRFDMQRSEELIEGWRNDEIYGSSNGLKHYVNEANGKVDIIIGGPPCQAYSIAGRVRDKEGMRNDYRNYLFESYLHIIKYFRPKVFVFENVPGLLSAKPGDGSFLIVDKIHTEFKSAGYYLLDNLKDAIVDMSEYGVPQNRKRIIIIGINNDFYSEKKAKAILDKIYFDELPSHQESKVTVDEAIGDLPKLYPLPEVEIHNGKRFSHTLNPDTNIFNHNPRFASKRDIEIFKLLTEDIKSGRNRYVKPAALKKLYTEITGKESNVHKFYVLRRDEQSNLIPAHLYKDGLRHIHPDPKQARTLTVREAARLQTFPDDFKFISNTNLDYKMIGNAVPPKFAKKLALSISKIFFKE